MEEIQLKDICDLDNGYAFKSDDYVDNSNTLNCRMSNIRPDGSFDILYSAKYLPDEFAEKYKDYILHDGDLIIAMTDMAGDPKILGVPTVVDTQGFCLLLNQRVGRLRFIRDGVNADYLKFALQCPKVRTYLKRFAGGGVQLNVSKKDILSAPVCMRNEEEQNHIAGLFKRVLEVKTKRERELQLLDDLIKARFVELFGDPQLNPFEWDVVNISEVVGGKVSNGFFAKRDDYTDTGNVSVLGVANIVNRMYSKIDDLPRTNADDKDIGKFAVRYGDMLFCRSSLVAEGIGKASIIPEDVQENVLFECHVIRLPLDLRKCVPEFMQTLSTMDYFRNQVIAQSKTATMTTIGQDGILKTEIILPPIEKQKEFYDFVKQVDKSKLTELFRAWDASCPKGKKMRIRKRSTALNLQCKKYFKFTASALL